MRISTPPYIVNIHRNQEVSLTQEPIATGKPAATTQKVQKSFDPVSISAKSREIDRLTQDVGAMPDVRLDRVALAKQQLQQGSYRVDSSILAQKMMGS